MDNKNKICVSSVTFVAPSVSSLIKHSFGLSRDKKNSTQQPTSSSSRYQVHGNFFPSHSTASECLCAMFSTQQYLCISLLSFTFDLHAISSHAYIRIHYTRIPSNRNGAKRTLVCVCVSVFVFIYLRALHWLVLPAPKIVLEIY